jgi:HAD superfamily hydrolase (TIGR01509 family)
MIKAIIFDCFGVLTSDGWLPFKDKYFENDADKYDEATKLNALANSNHIPYSQFISMVSDLANVSETELNKAMHESVRNEKMLELIRNLKKDYKIGMLSNISGDWLRELFTDEQIGLFDATALSYETGYAKPDNRAYKVIYKRLKCEPQECVYIDDQPSFVDAAQELGMHSIHFTGLSELEARLSDILITKN